MNLVAIIPARGGSKGIPQKNLALLNGKPLITYTLSAALKSTFINHIVVSSDDNAILACATNFFKNSASAKTHRLEVQKRPSPLSRDGTLMKDVILHILNQLPNQWQYFIVLQPTSPLRTSKDIDKAFQIMTARGGKSLISVQQKPHATYKYFKSTQDQYLTGLVSPEAPFSNRQSTPDIYAANGALYIFSIRAFMAEKKFPMNKTVPFIMDDRSSLDIDTPADLVLAEKWLQT